MDHQPVMIIVYLIGVAGVGKSTTVKQLTADWSLRMKVDKPFAHRHYSTKHGRAIIIGKDIEPFGGTDTLSYTAINSVDGFLATCVKRNVKIIVAEGDRLANNRFLTMAQQHGTLLLFNLHAADDITEQRRAQRAIQHNTSTQNANWIRGRKTKVATLATTFKAITIDATQPTINISQMINSEMERCLTNEQL